MATYNKFNRFTTDLLNGVHNFSTGTFNVFLTNQTPSVSSNVSKQNLTDLATGSGYTANGNTTTISYGSGPASQVNVKATNVSFTSTGTIGPFQYAVIFNQGVASQPLIGYWDYGSSLQLNNGETLNVTFDQANGIFQIA